MTSVLKILESLEREDGLVADIRHPESLLNFDDFNDVPEQDDAARKYFICTTW